MARYILPATLISLRLLMGFMEGSMAGLMYNPVAKYIVGTVTRPLICSSSHG